jgi:hypothetical protein
MRAGFVLVVLAKDFYATELRRKELYSPVITARRSRPVSPWRRYVT